MQIKKVMRLSVLFIIMGFVGSAVRYWRWWPSHSTSYIVAAGIVCPLCPNIDGVGADWDKFVGRTYGGGLLNLVPALLVGWAAVGLSGLRGGNRVKC